MANRLAGESSPYLLQHQNNPVDWYPWGEEALQRARTEDRPILLSIGYSACHWCHVMEHESFEDEETARLMNEHYVNIKVDREERPDLDSIYMNAVQQMTGRGGWPMTVFLRPDGAPFYGGTYFPPEAKHGLPSFRHVLVAISDAYQSRRGDVDRSASELLDMLRQGSALRAPAEQLDSITLGQAFRHVAARFDPRFGGFGSAPKFPQPMVLSFLLRYWLRTRDGDALAMVEHTLLRMAAGGMYDQVGGGFHRYSVDARWLVPHFEKMLYDNALLARSYLQAHLATGNPEFRRVTEDVLDFVLREMQSPNGGFYSTLDADSEGEEGKFYVWKREEILSILGPADGALFCRYFDVTSEGNFEGHNILHVDRDLHEVAGAEDVTPADLAAVIARGRELLYAERAKRVWPGLDDKILTGWNAMMIRVMAEAGFALSHQKFLASAIKNADFLLLNLRREGQLLRSYKDGVARIDGFLEDHALLVDALVSLYQASFDPRWLSEARELADTMIAKFWAPTEGIFYDAQAGDSDLVVRARDINDTATPSGSSAAVMALLRLAALTGEGRYAAPAEEAIRSIGGLLAQIPHGFAEMLSALDLHLSRVSEIAIVGEPDSADTQAMLEVLRSRYLPNAVWALRRPSWTEKQASEVTPLLVDREALDGYATAYVCENFSCRLPVTDPALLAAELA